MERFSWYLSYISLDPLWVHYFLSRSQQLWRKVLLLIFFFLVVFNISAKTFLIITIFLNDLFSKLTEKKSCAFHHWSCFLKLCSLLLLSYDCSVLQYTFYNVVLKSRDSTKVWQCLTRTGSSAPSHLSLLSGTQTSCFHRQCKQQGDEVRSN